MGNSKEVLQAIDKLLKLQGVTVGFENYLREDGWVHLDDVVEGAESDQKCMGGPMPKVCVVLPARACCNCDHWTDNRPATVRDLIERKG